MTDDFKANTPTTEEVLHRFLQSRLEWTKPEHTRAFNEWLINLQSEASAYALLTAANSVGSPLLKDDEKQTTLGEVKAWLRECAEQFKKEETSD